VLRFKCRPSFVRRESLWKSSPGIRDGILQAGISPGAESQRLGPTDGASSKELGGLRAQLDHWPGISFHVGVCPAGAEAQKGDE